MRLKYKVKLSAAQRKRLLTLINTGQGKAKKLTHARILLQADCSSLGLALKSKVIAKHLNIHEKTVRQYP